MTEAERQALKASMLQFAQGAEEAPAPVAGPANAAADVVAASGKAAPGKGEALVRGAAQGATLGFGDEIVGAARTAGDLLVNPQMAGEGLGAIKSRYRDHRDETRENNAAAEKAHGGYYLGGNVIGGALPAFLVGAPAGAIEAAVSGAGFATAAGAGASEAEDASGVAKDALKAGDTGAIAGVAGSGIAAAGRAASNLVARMKGDKLVAGLTKYLDNIVTRGGDPRAQKAAAGKLMEKAIEVAGDERIPVARFTELADTLAKESQNPFRKGLEPVSEEVIASAEKMAGKGATLGEMHNGLKYWTAKADSLSRTDPQAARIAVMAKKALQEELENVSPALGKASELYSAGRQAYAKGAAAEDLRKILTGAKDATSPGGALLNPRKFATLNSGSKKAAVDRYLAKLGPEAKEAWDMGVEASRVLASRGKSWIPKQVTDLSPKVREAAGNLMKSFDATKVFTDPAAAAEFRALALSPRNLKAEEALAVISRLSARLDGGGPAAAAQPQLAAQSSR